MKTPFLVIGYERSGTTLVRRLMSMHPALEYDLVHERPREMLKCKKTKQAIRKLTSPATQAGEKTGGTMSILAGQKIPYVNYIFALRVVKHFISLFPEASIVHVVRNPAEVIESQVRTFKKNATKCAEAYKSSVPPMIKFCSRLRNRNAMICYGRVTSEPMDLLRVLYEWMGEEVDEEHIKKVISTRDPWDYDGRMMCGLRYFDSVKAQKKDIPKHINKLVQNAMPRLANVELRGK